MNVIPMLKVDAATRMVYARIDETPDRAGDIFDYESSKPVFQAWSDDMVKASDGKSLGNVRGMHGLVAAGRLVEMNFDDAARAIDIAIEVVDDGEMTKVAKGVYTGISPGGKFIRRWRDGKYTRYTSGVSEISLVDVPCMTNGTFTMMKLDGGEELVAFAEPSDAARAALLAAQLENVEGVDDYRAIVAAQSPDMLKLLFPEGVPEQLQPAPADSGDMIKGLFTVALFSGVIEQLTDMAQGVSWEAAYEGDGSDLPRQLAAWIKTGAMLLTSMAAEESAEAVAALQAAVDAIPADQAADTAVDAAIDVEMVKALMLKAGARNSASDAGLIQGIHDQACALGAECGGAGAGGDMAKVGYLPVLARHVGDAAILRDEMKKVTQDRDMLKLRVSELEKLPATGGPRLRVVDRRQDGSPAGGGSDVRIRRRAEIDAMSDGVEKATAEARFTMEFGR